MKPSRRSMRAWLAGATAACATAFLLPTLIAHASVEEPTTAPVVGNSTWFEALGSPYGGCGLPQADLDSQNFVALNVYDTPRDYAFYTRPMPEGDSKIGMWNNGHNCGRWVQVSIDDYCTGVNDGAPDQAFCRNGQWVEDQYNGAVLNMLVADSCGDSNGWCRDDPYHLDLAKASLSRFTKNGSPVGDLLPDHYNNRHISWKFISAPDYTGDIQIGFLQGAQRWWAAMAVSHLPNGVHGVEYLIDGAWKPAKMNGDMGQSFIIEGTTAGATAFTIRVRDVNDQLVNGGRQYSFSLPDSCANQCSAAYTKVAYTTDSTVTTPPTTPGVTPTTPNTSPSGPLTTPTTSSTPPATSCAASYAVTGQWSGGFQAEVTVRNNGTALLSGWKVSWALPSGQSIGQVWNGVSTTSGDTVTVGNTAWNGALGPNATTTFGMIGSGTAQSTPTLSCTPA